MAKTVEQLMQEFKVENLDDNFLKALRSEITEAHTQLSQATSLKTEAEQARAAAVQERARIDQAILEMGDGSLNASRLKAQNKVLKAALDSLKEDGLSIDLPEDLFKETPEPQQQQGGSMTKEMKDSMALMGQAIAAADVAARYVGIYGKPMPVDMQTLVRNAQQSGKTVQQYADQEFKLSDRMKEQSTAAEEARIAKMKQDWEAEYKTKHPVTNESPFMRPGASSRFTEMPKIKREDPSQTRTTAGLSDMEKLRRSQEHGRQMLAQSLQEN